MLIFSLFGLTGLFIINILFGMYYGFGTRHYWFFELEHFLGGFFVAMFLSIFLNSIIAIFVGLTVITVIWETTEYLIAQFNKKIIPSWKDTLLDIFLNFIGATVFIVMQF